MTDRHAGYIVTLDHDIHGDDAQPILDALRMVKGVLAVDPIVADPDAWIARLRVNDIWRNALIELLRNPPPGSMNAD